MTDHVKQVKDSIRQPQGPKRSGLFLSSGCTLLNLALTGKTGSCWEAGSYYLLVGDSRSGKTFIVLGLRQAGYLPRSPKQAGSTPARSIRKETQMTLDEVIWRLENLRDEMGGKTTVQAQIPYSPGDSDDVTIEKTPDGKRICIYGE